MDIAWSWVDIAIATILALTVLYGLGRGMVRTAISILTWVAAFYAAYVWGESAASQLKPYLANEELRLWLVRFGIFILVILIGTIVGNIVGTFDRGRWIDRLLGLVLGGALGSMIVAIALLALGLTSFPETALFKESHLIPYFIDLAEWLKGYLPLDMQREINLSQAQTTSGTN